MLKYLYLAIFMLWQLTPALAQQGGAVEFSSPTYYNWLVFTKPNSPYRYFMVNENGTYSQFMQCEDANNCKPDVLKLILECNVNAQKNGFQGNCKTFYSQIRPTFEWQNGGDFANIERMIYRKNQSGKGDIIGAGRITLDTAVQGNWADYQRNNAPIKYFALSEDGKFASWNAINNFGNINIITEWAQFRERVLLNEIVKCQKIANPDYNGLNPPRKCYIYAEGANKLWAE